MTFEELGLHDKILEAISYMNFKEATPIQEMAIPLIMEGRDLIGCAQTGTGKTAAFILPIIDKILENPTDKTNTLVIVPTRELAIQIEQQIQGFAYFGPVGSIAIYGGGDGKEWPIEKKALTNGMNFIVATPGKLIAHLNMGYVDFSSVEHLILDEADRMLDMGFSEDIKKIVKHLPQKRQNLLFSATMPKEIRALADELLHDPEEITLSLAKPAEGVLQAAYLVYPEQKTALVKRLINDKPNYKSILLFTSTKKMVSEIVRALQGPGYSVKAISSDLEQSERNEVLNHFKAKQIRVLVATDVLSRGIDIKDIDLVINFDVPGDAEDYVHRVGRTARAASTGVAITLVSPDDMYRFHKIERLIEREVPKAPLPPEIGEAPTWNIGRNKSGGYRRGKPRGKSNKGNRRN